MSLTAQNSEKKTGREPLLVRLGRGEVQERTWRRFADFLPRLHHDPLMDCSSCLQQLVLTKMHIIIRFDEFLAYPTKGWMLSLKYNPDFYQTEIVAFLQMQDEDLDAGYFLPLRNTAWRHGGGVENDAVRYLEGDGPQAELDSIFENGDGCSLDVERKHAWDKVGETQKVTSCAMAIRNAVLRAYHR